MVCVGSVVFGREDGRVCFCLLGEGGGGGGGVYNLESYATSNSKYSGLFCNLKLMYVVANLFVADSLLYLE